MTEIKNENTIYQRGPSPADYMNLMNKIPTYSGSRDVNKAELWLKTVRSYKGFFSVNFNHEMFLTAVTNSFTDRAEDWWDTVSGTALWRTCCTQEHIMVTDIPIFFPIQENVFTVSLPETEEFSVESAPVESAPVVRLIYYNFHPYKFCGDIELVLEELAPFCAVTTWEDFLSKFKSKFIQPTVGETWRKLRSIQQEQGNTVEHFTSELNVLFKAAGIKDEEMKISLFISGVNSDIGFELEKKRKNLRTYEDVIEEAASLESLLMKYNKNINIKREKKISFVDEVENKPIVSGSTLNNDTSSVSTQDTLEKLISSMNQLSINIVQQQEQIKLSQQQQQQSQPQQFNARQGFHRPPYGGEKRFVCWNCGKDGHASRFCPDPPVNRNYQENNNNHYNDQQQGKANGQQ
ncbi:hypothetical protein MFLAVUS_011420 [Mucor flavus]|uniref:CCHC-type domain-containing protein n=1 Tax=Mucor flavus TaxID=439312 RepID=A0ABP9ZFG9_9FUNG